MSQFTIENVAFTINLLIDLLGALLFIPLIYVSLKYKKLHAGHCMKLMVLYFMCCLGSKVIIILPYLIKVVPLPNVPLYLCIFVQIVPMSMTCMMMPLTMAIALDRWLSVFFPIWYSQKRSVFYLPILLAIAAAYPIFLDKFIFENLMENFNIQTNCTTGNLYGKQLDIDWVWAFNGFTILCYILIFGKLLWDGREGRKAYFHRQPIFKSLALIIGIQIVGWLLTQIGYRYIIGLLRGNLNLTEDQIPLLCYFINYFSSLSSTIEVPAIYFTSCEYRMALKKEFGWFFRLFCRKNGNLARNSIAPNTPMLAATVRTKTPPKMLPNTKTNKIQTPQIFVIPIS